MGDRPAAGVDGGGADERWRPGSRVARLRASHSYRWVFVMVLATFVVIGAAPPGDVTEAVLMLLLCATLMLALWTSGLGRGLRIVLAPLAVGIVGAAAALLDGGSTLHGTVWLLDVVLVVAIVAAIGVGVFDQGEVNQQSVSGAVCIYLLLGMLFTFAYGAAAALGSFFAQGTDGTPALRLYFSYVTLATVGYGDYTAAGNLGHMLAITEALLGQVYLVTVVAVLVSQLGRVRA